MNWLKNRVLSNNYFISFDQGWPVVVSKDLDFLNTYFSLVELVRRTRLCKKYSKKAERISKNCVNAVDRSRTINIKLSYVVLKAKIRQKKKSLWLLKTNKTKTINKPTIVSWCKVCDIEKAKVLKSWTVWSSNRLVSYCSSVCSCFVARRSIILSFLSYFM